jgi:sugar/nucleoside kinase (ribokinase family)
MKTASSQTRSGILAGGNWIIDQVKRIDLYPSPEKLANIHEHQRGTGGAPYNVLVDLAKLGAPFPLYGAGLVGRDRFGEEILEICKRHKIDTRALLTTAAAATSYTDVMTEVDGGRRTFFHFRGANALWDGKGLDLGRHKARIFHLGYLLLLDSLDLPDKRHGTKAAALLAAAQEAGMKTSVDVVSEDSDRFSRIVMPSLKLADYCIINEFEAGKVTGFKVRSPEGVLDPVALRHAAGAILQLGVRDLVAIHFPEGGFVRTRKGEDHWHMSLNVPARLIAGTAGAGDAFCAGVLFGLHEGWDLARCLHLGICASAACLFEATCTAGMKSVKQVLDLPKRYRPRPPIEPQD